MALHGRDGMQHFRARVRDTDLERDLCLSLLSPVNLLRLLAGGVNDRSNLAATLDAGIFRGATFADLTRRNKPDVWINATDLYNRTPFPFIPPVFQGLCSDLSQLRVSGAVAASMAVPLAFAPVVLKRHPQLPRPSAHA
jgi:NTE family protein